MSNFNNNFPNGKNFTLVKYNYFYRSIIEQIKHQENIVLFVVGDHGMTSTGIRVF